jgi:molecular chaperone GrpE (heat shock protein)
MITGMLDAYAAALPDEPADALRAGLNGAWERLEQTGVERDGAAGEALDTARHKVVKRRASEGVSAGRVLQVLSPGVLFRGTRVRDAAVIVGKEARHAPSGD